MKAMRFHSYGDSGVLVYEDADRPVAGPGQVVLKVAGSAFNPLDVAIRGGFVQQAFPVALPHIPGFDMAGVVEEVGSGSTSCSTWFAAPRTRRRGWLTWRPTAGCSSAPPSRS